MPRSRTPPRRSGFLNIDKPPGWTSHDVVGRVRRVVGERQVGHTGTLDPAASGVLVVAVGHATKVLSFLDRDDKTYIATVRFGIVTDSGDRDGRLIAKAHAGHVTAATVEAHLAAFHGTIVQAPPMHSAIKVEGRKLYELARQGAEIDVPVRTVTIDEVELLDWQPPDATIRIACSKGTYIRSFARDIGAAVGTGAMLANLVRTRSGRFSLDASIPLEELGNRLDQFGWRWIASHPDSVLDTTDVLVLDPCDERRWFNGVPIASDAATELVRVYDSRRDWIGIGLADRSRGTVQPKRVVRGNVE